MGAGIDDAAEAAVTRRRPRLARLVCGMLAGAAVVPAALAAAGSAATAAATAPPACAVDAGVGVLWNWSMGAPPPIQTPPLGWRQSVHPTNPLLNFFVPGDWSTAVLPVPDWLAGTWQAYNWSGVRVSSPDGTTGVEIASTPVIGLHDAAAAAAFGVQGLFGEIEPTVLCAGESAATGSSIEVVESGGTLAYVAGYAYADAALNQTVFVSYAAFAPADAFAATTSSVFIPVFYQFYRNGGTDSNDGEQGPETTG